MFDQLLVQLSAFLPVFPVAAESLSFLSSPQEFYEAIINGVKGSKQRVIIATLYVGTEEQEQNLADTLKSTIRERRREGVPLKVHIHMDYHRGTRQDELGNSSKKLLDSIDASLTTALYQSPLSRGWFKERIVPARWNELFGLSHMKIAIFDDDVLLTGANISKSYFTNRADRYLLIKNQPELADYFSDVVEACGQDVTSEIPAKLKSLEKYKHREISKTCDTFIVPSLQMGPHGVSDDTKLVKALFDWTNQSDTPLLCSMATGYFNPSPMMLSLLESSIHSWKLLTSSPDANGFQGSQGWSKHIPALYRNVEYRFLKDPRLSKHSIYEYSRLGWTFHGKGIWIEHPEWTITSVGSTNFGQRSFERDLEAQALVLTKSPALMKQICLERQALFSHSQRVHLTDLRRGPLFVNVVGKLFSSYL